jgi:hypothetical protein
MPWAASVRSSIALDRSPRRNDEVLPLRTRTVSTVGNERSNVGRRFVSPLAFEIAVLEHQLIALLPTVDLLINQKTKLSEVIAR